MGRAHKTKPTSLPMSKRSLWNTFSFCRNYLIPWGSQWIKHLMELGSGIRTGDLHNGVPFGSAEI